MNTTRYGNRFTFAERRSGSFVVEFLRTSSLRRSLDGRGDVLKRTEEHKGIILRRKEASTPPEGSRLVVDGAHDERATAHEPRGLDASSECVLE